MNARSLQLTVNGLSFHVRLAGPVGRRAPALVLLHGFTGSWQTWEPFWPELASQRPVVAPDLLGHGASDAPADPARYRISRAMEDLVGLLDALGLYRVHLLGYSMGGRLALHVAASVPHRLASLVLESASPGIADPAERQARRAADEELAEFIEQHGIEAFVDRWERHPLFETQRFLPEEVRLRLRRQRLAQRPHGLANSLRGMGAGAQEPLWERLPELRLPVLLLVGELDQRYRHLAEAMAARLPSARLVVAAGAGHAVHLERPDAFMQALARFLREVDEAGARCR